MRYVLSIQFNVKILFILFKVFGFLCFFEGGNFFYYDIMWFFSESDSDSDVIADDSEASFSDDNPDYINYQVVAEGHCDLP